MKILWTGFIKSENDEYSLVFELTQGMDRSILQNENPHIVFFDSYNNFMSFDYMLRECGKEKLVSITEKSESTIAMNDKQYQYNMTVSA